MSRFLGTIITLIGLGLLTSGLLIPRGLGSAFWQGGLGLLLLMLGFAMVLTADRNAGRALAGLLGLLGLALLIASLAPRLLWFSLYSTAGALLRGLFGLIFCVTSYALFEFGNELFGYADDVDRDLN